LEAVPRGPVAIVITFAAKGPSANTPAGASGLKLAGDRRRVRLGILQNRKQDSSAIVQVRANSLCEIGDDSVCHCEKSVITSYDIDDDYVGGNPKSEVEESGDGGVE